MFNHILWKREAAARQAHTQLERLSLEQKSMILDQALQVRAETYPGRRQKPWY